MRYTIKQKGEKYYKKFKPCGAEWVVMIIIIITWIYILFEVIRG
jgi:energy-coupling factor transporter transmembrane protein EcfT